MKGEQKPGIRNTPFVSSNKAVFQLSLWSAERVPGFSSVPTSWE